MIFLTKIIIEVCLWKCISWKSTHHRNCAVRISTIPTHLLWQRKMIVHWTEFMRMRSEWLPESWGGFHGGQNAWAGNLVCGLLIVTFFCWEFEPKCKLIDSSQLRPILNGDILKSVGSHYAIVGPNEFSLFHMGPQLLDVQLCNFNSNSIWRGLVADGCFCFFIIPMVAPSKTV